MAEKAVAEMGRRPAAVEAAAKKLLPPIVPDRRLAMEMAPRIMVVASLFIYLQKKYYVVDLCPAKNGRWRRIEGRAGPDDGQTN